MDLRNVGILPQHYTVSQPKDHDVSILNVFRCLTQHFSLNTATNFEKKNSGHKTYIEPTLDLKLTPTLVQLQATPTPIGPIDRSQSVYDKHLTQQSPNELTQIQTTNYPVYTATTRPNFIYRNIP